MELAARIPESWRSRLAGALAAPGFLRLEQFLAADYATATVYPRFDDLFTALQLTPPEAVKVVILGQDPYHGPGQAHGLAFSVPPLTSLPPSLKNIFKELEADLGLPPPLSGSLVPWAKEGVLLLNTVLSVRAGTPGSHAGQGWEAFTDAVIAAVNGLPERVVFVLWGGPAQTKAQLVSNPHHVVLKAPHPSPLSSYRGFFGSRPFSTANAKLEEAGRSPIRWTLD